MRLITGSNVSIVSALPRSGFVQRPTLGEVPAYNNAELLFSQASIRSLKVNNYTYPFPNAIWGVPARHAAVEQSRCAVVKICLLPTGFIVICCYAW
jgi:hypothetical protein